MQNSNEELILAIKRGDLDAFEELYKKYYIFLCLIAEHIVRNKCDAEEVVSDVFVKIWNMRAEINITTSVKAYLIKAAYNTSLNFLKQNKLLNRSTELPDSSDYELLAWDSDYPLGQLYTKEVMGILENGIKSLPEMCREIYMLSRNDDMTYCAIANKLGISVNTVKTQMKIALSRLRETVRDYLILLLFFFVLH
jgi:RNA polymerase sigma-70 factor (ECF subfamily)